MALVLGVDPGSRVTGFGVIEANGGRRRYVASGSIRTGELPLAERLKIIHDGVTEVIERHAPAEFAIEKVFVHRGAEAALKLGHARGAAILAAVGAGLDVSEYAAPKIKQAVTGSGSAGKEQVTRMVARLLGVEGALGADAADALAVAICHAHSRMGLARLAGARAYRRSRLR